MNDDFELAERQYLDGLSGVNDPAGDDGDPQSQELMTNDSAVVANPDEEMIAHEVSVCKWHYAMTITETTPICADGSVRCPVCNAPMEIIDDCYPDAATCINDDCPFVLNDAVQAVVNAMMDSRSSDKGYDDALLEALEIARSYTLDEDTTFRIKDRESAGWLMKKLAKIDASERDINADVDARKAELQAEIIALEERRTEMLLPFERDRVYLTVRYQPELEEWAKSELKDSRGKSIKLSYGVAGYKKCADSLVIDDDTAVEEVAIKCGHRDDVMRIKTEINKTGLKALLADDSQARENFAGVAYIKPGTDEFFIKPTMPVEVA